MKTEKALLAVRRVLAERKEVPLDISLAGKSGRSRVWRVQSDQNVYAFKVHKSLNKSRNGTLPPGTDADLRRLLTEKGARVPRPYLTSEDINMRNFRWAWSLDEFIQGPTLAPRNLRPDWALSLGRTLKTLHDLDPAELKDRHGLYKSVPAAITKGFGDDVLTEIARRASDLKSPHVELFRKIREALESDQHDTSICHADVHKNQLIISGEKRKDLTLIDFGEARICSRNWELGAILIKFGRDAFSQFAQGYGQEVAKNSHVLPYAWCLAFAHMSSNRTNLSRKAARQFLLETRYMSSL